MRCDRYKMLVLGIITNIILQLKVILVCVNINSFWYWWYLFLPREVDFRPCSTLLAFICNFCNLGGVNLRKPTSSETRVRLGRHLASWKVSLSRHLSSQKQIRPLTKADCESWLPDLSDLPVTEWLIVKNSKTCRILFFCEQSTVQEKQGSDKWITGH